MVRYESLRVSLRCPIRTGKTPREAYLLIRTAEREKGKREEQSGKAAGFQV